MKKIKSIDLQTINDNSLSKTIFYIKGICEDELIDSLDYFNIVFASNGVFQVNKNPLFIHFKKININYSNDSLQYIDDGKLIQLIQKPNIEIMYKIIDIFVYVKDKITYEIMINLYFDTIKNDFVIDIVDQKISAGSIEYTYNDFYENDSRYIRYLQIHSHHLMKAFFSSTDDSDEKNTCQCYFGVVGKLNTKYLFDHKYRIYSNNEFVSLEPQYIFDGFKSDIDLDQPTMNYLDKLIINSTITNDNIFNKMINLKGK